MTTPPLSHNSRDDGSCGCTGDRLPGIHRCGENLPPLPGPSVEIVPGVESAVCERCGGWLELTRLDLVCRCGAEIVQGGLCAICLAHEEAKFQ